jgi:LysR family hydrogen peroxide-inducible transcriptional activator
VRLTDKGREIAARASRILGDVRNLIEYARYSGGVLAGSLRFGVIPSVAPYLLPPLLPLLREAYPELDLHVRETQTHSLVEELIDGKLDVLLLALPINHPDIECLPLVQDRFLLAMPKSRRPPRKVRATPGMIEHEHLLLLEEGHCLRDQALSYCSLQRAQGIDTFGASSLSTIVEMVAAGLGVTLLPEICLGVESRGRDLAYVRFCDPEPSRSLGLAWRSSSPRRADFSKLGELVMNAWRATQAALPASMREVSAASS